MVKRNEAGDPLRVAPGHYRLVHQIYSSANSDVCSVVSFKFILSKHYVIGTNLPAWATSMRTKQSVKYTQFL